MLPLGHVGVNFMVLNLFRRMRSRRNLTLLVLGSLLPDIIDKPLGLLMFHGFGNGRLIAHTLMFNLAILAIVLAFKRDLVIVPTASLLHLIEDRMWREPKILFYPFMGDFPKKPVVPWYVRIERIVQAYHDPTILLSDLLGAILLIVFVGCIAKQQKEFKDKRSAPK